MEAIGGGLLACSLPVGVDDEALRWTEHFHAFVRAQEQHVVIPLGVAKKLVERRSVNIPGGENQAAIQRDPGLSQTQLLFGQHLAVHAFTIDRRADEVAVGTKRPAVIDALVNLGVAAVGSADAHASVRADVKSDMDLAFLVAGNDHRVRTQVADHEVAGIGDFRLMAQQNPDFAENLLHFDFVDFAIRQYTHLYFASRWIDQVCDFGSIRQYGACSC